MNNEANCVKQAISSLGETSSSQPETFGLKSLRALHRLIAKIFTEKIVSSQDKQQSLLPEKLQRVVTELQMH